MMGLSGQTRGQDEGGVSPGLWPANDCFWFRLATGPKLEEPDCLRLSLERRVKHVGGRDRLAETHTLV